MQLPFSNSARASIIPTDHVPAATSSSITLLQLLHHPSSLGEQANMTVWFIDVIIEPVSRIFRHCCIQYREEILDDAPFWLI